MAVTSGLGGRRNFATEADRERWERRLVAAYKGDVHINDMKARFGCSAEHIHDIAKKYGVSRSPGNKTGRRYVSEGNPYVDHAGRRSPDSPYGTGIEPSRG